MDTTAVRDVDTTAATELPSSVWVDRAVIAAVSKVSAGWGSYAEPCVGIRGGMVCGFRGHALVAVPVSSGSSTAEIQFAAAAAGALPKGALCLTPVAGGATGWVQEMGAQPPYCRGTIPPAPNCAVPDVGFVMRLASEREYAAVRHYCVDTLITVLTALRDAEKALPKSERSSAVTIETPELNKAALRLTLGRSVALVMPRAGDN